jgi:hypothetical protein
VFFNSVPAAETIGVARFFLVQHTKNEKIVPNYQEIYQRLIKRPNGNIGNIPTSSIARPPNIYPNWDIWFENIPSGNPGEYSDLQTRSQSRLLLRRYNIYNEG